MLSMIDSPENPRPILYSGHTMGAPGWNIYEVIRGFREIGYDAIEVRVAPDGQINSETVTDEECIRILAAAREEGMAFSPFVKFHRLAAAPTVISKAPSVRALISIEDEELQYETALYIFDKRLSVRETEAYVKKVLTAPKSTVEKASSKDDFSFLYKDIEERIKSSLGTKATIKAKNKNKGKIEIEYYSEDELDRITQILLNAN